VRVLGDWTTAFTHPDLELAFALFGMPRVPCEPRPVFLQEARKGIVAAAIYNKYAVEQEDKQQQ